MKLINVDKLKAEFDLIASKSATGEWFSIPIKHIKQIIDNAPPVDISKEIWNKSNELLNKRLSYLGKPQSDWGKWVISEVRCPNCLKYFDTDCYSKKELSKCPNCGADMRGAK